MDWRLMKAGGDRRIENFLSGVNPTPLGHLAVGAASAGMIGSALVQNKYGNPTIANREPGISQAEAMSYDMRRNAPLGASGDLTLALSNFGFEK